MTCRFDACPVLCAAESLRQAPVEVVLRAQISEHSLNIHWTFIEHSLNIQWTFIEHSVNIPQVVVKNVNPLEKMERSALLVAGSLQQVMIYNKQCNTCITLILYYVLLFVYHMLWEGSTDCYTNPLSRRAYFILFFCFISECFVRLLSLLQRPYKTLVQTCQVARIAEFSAPRLLVDSSSEGVNSQAAATQQWHCRTTSSLKPCAHYTSGWILDMNNSFRNVWSHNFWMMGSWDTSWETSETGVRDCMFQHLAPLGEVRLQPKLAANRLIIIIIIIIIWIQI